MEMTKRNLGGGRLRWLITMRVSIMTREEDVCYLTILVDILQPATGRDGYSWRLLMRRMSLLLLQSVATSPQ